MTNPTSSLQHSSAISTATRQSSDPSRASRISLGFSMGSPHMCRRLPNLGHRARKNVAHGGPMWTNQNSFRFTSAAALQ